MNFDDSISKMKQQYKVTLSKKIEFQKLTSILDRNLI